jgi:hypothetical protein
MRRGWQVNFFSNLAARRRNSPEAVRRAVIGFLSTGDPVARRHMLRDHPELLNPLADDLLAYLIHSAEADWTDDLVPKLDGVRFLLRRCRTIGVDAAFAELGLRLPTDPAYPARGKAPSPAVLSLVDQATTAYEVYEQRHDRSSAEVTEQWFERLMSHSDFPRADIELRLRVLNAFADFLSQRYQEDDEAPLLEREISFRRQVVDLAPGDWPDRPRYLRLLGSALLRRWSRSRVRQDKSEAISYLRAGGAEGF